MTKNDITTTDTGSVVAFDETDEERAERLRKAGDEAAQKVSITPGQRRVLARVRDRARRHPEAG